jgi:glycosyltransferase involved in cell wall biosynthesis
MIRTLHIDTGRTMQGGQWQVLYLLERLKNTTLLAPTDSPLLAEARKRGLDAQPLLKFLGEMSRADIVHAHDSRAHTYAAVANYGDSKRLLVVSRRVAFPVKQSMVSRWKYLQPTIFLAVSKYVASKLRNVVEKGVIRVVHDGIPIPSSPAQPEPGRVVAVPSKSVELPGIPVHLATNLFDDLSTASVFLYVSDMEGLGSAAIAAMAAGVPVVASGVGGLPEVVEHEKTGLIVRDGDYAKAVRRLLDNPKLAADLGAAGREKAKREFSVEKMVQNTLSAYNEILR